MRSRNIYSKEDRRSSENFILVESTNSWHCWALCMMKAARNCIWKLSGQVFYKRYYLVLIMASTPSLLQSINLDVLFFLFSNSSSFLCFEYLCVFNQWGWSKTESISLKRLVVFQARRYKRNERPGNVCFPTGFKSNLKRSKGTRNVTLFWKAGYVTRRKRLDTPTYKVVCFYTIWGRKKVHFLIFPCTFFNAKRWE